LHYLKLSILFGLLLSVLSCSRKSEENSLLPKIQDGNWTITFTEQGLNIPIRLVFEDEQFTIVNSEERILTSKEWVSSDSLRVELPIFGTYLNIKIHSSDSLTGQWVNPFKDPVYFMNFTGKKDATVINELQQKNYDSSKYAVRFSPDTQEEYPAVGVFQRNDTEAKGTFLTETGDYRYLEGKCDDEGFWLSCFDGAHLFFFNAKNVGSDSLKGSFHSGKHWSEQWEGVLNPSAKLLNPDSITTLIGSSNKWGFQVFDSTLTEINYDSNSFLGKVTIVQLFGSWCPNCMDESKYFKKLHSKYALQGLSIIPVAFERGADSTKWKNAVNEYSTGLGLDYPYYLGGSASKGRAREVFSMLSDITSFPTTIFIDKSGAIRKIHTGFYGPGTGKYYDEYTKSTEALIQQLLSE